MAHNLNIKKDGTASFVAVGEVAWHGLGTYVKEAMTVKEVIEKSGLDFEVEKKPIGVIGGAPIESFFATVRKDTQDVLGVVSPDYTIVQNRDVFRFFDPIIDKDEAIYQTAGALGKGERIFITAKLPQDIEVRGEQIENYLLLSSGHDGKSAIQVGFTSVRVVCANTLNVALKGLKNKVSILHFKNAQEKLETAHKIMGMSSKHVTQLTPIFNKMADTKLTDKRLREYLEKVMMPASKETLTKEELEASFSKRFINKIDSIMDFAHEHPTQKAKAAKGTVWGAYNAVSGYFGYLKSYKSQEDKMQDLYFKGGAGTIEKAFQLASELVK